MRISYDSLTKIVCSQKAYRGREDNYPTHGHAYRKHSNKFFKPEVVDNEVVYRINYGRTWNKIPCSESEALMLEKLGRQVMRQNKIVYNPILNIHEESKEVEYSYYEIVPNELGIVHPDNTFEFTSTTSLGQGGRYYVGTHCFNTDDVVANCRLGGVILDYKYPLFKGLRIDLENMNPAKDQQIEFFKKVVNRSAAKELYAPYKEMLSVSKAMFSQMDDKVFVASLHDVLNDHKIVWEWDADEKWNRQFTQGRDVVKIADKLREEGNYFDSAMLYGYGYDMGGITWRVRHHHNWIKKDMFVNMDKFLRKTVYEHKKPFDLKPVEYGSGATSAWGFILKHNGISVNQYAY
jgi:hypothetical protein